MSRLLLVEDQPDLRDGLSEHLRARGYDVQVASTAADAIAAVRTARPALMILDLMLPDLPGDRVLRTTRREGFDGPVLILSARADEASKLRGFRAGADDYVTKPFSLLELFARVERLIHRISPQPLPDRIPLDERVVVHPDERRVVVSGSPVDLRPRVFDLLLALLRRPNQAVSRETLLTGLWGYEKGARTRTVDWHIAELRRRIERDPARPALVETVRGYGYRLRVFAGREGS